MTIVANNRFVQFMGPLVLVAAAYAALPLAGHLQGLAADLMPIAPYLLGVTAMVLGVIFDRQRVVLGALVVMVGYWSYRTAQGLPPDEGDLVYLALCVLLPLNLAWVNSRAERGLLSPHGLFAWAMILGQVVATAWVLEHWPGPAFTVLAFEVVLEPRLAQLTPIPQLGLIALAMALAWTLTQMAQRRNALAGGSLGSLVAVALALHFFNVSSAGPVFFGAAELILAITLAYHSYQLAYMDELTNLPGRRALNETLRRLRGQYTVAMVDVDHFKAFNDTYGHDVGDQVLKMVASKIRQVGGGGKAFRYGGEEFSIIFPNKGIKQAFPFLSNVREAVDNSHMILRGKDRPNKKPRRPQPPGGPVKQVHVTISIGMAESEPGSDPETVIKAADQALYRAKQKGRNRLST